MAQVTIDIPAGSVNRVQDSFAAKFGWKPDLGITKAQFTKQQLIAFMKRVVKEHEGDVQSDALRTTIHTDVDTISIT